MEDTKATRGPSARDTAVIAAFSDEFTSPPDAASARAMGQIDAAMDTWLPPNAMTRLFRTLHAMDQSK